MTAIANESRLRELDCLRGIAAVVVMLFHYTTRYDQLFGHVSPLSVSVPYGYYGVQLFFCISGFVIFMTLDKTRRPMDFVVSRVSRLYPAYWMAVFVTFFLVRALGLPGKEVGYGVLLVNLTMFQELMRLPHVDGVYWTLQVELLFYLHMLLIYRLQLLDRVDAILIAWISLRILYVALDGWFGLELSWTLGMLLILKHIPFFAIGMVFYRVLKQEHITRSSFVVLGLAWFAASLESGLDSLVAAACLAVFSLFVTRRLTFLVTSPLVFLGAISYSLYLLHENIGWALIRKLAALGLSPYPSIAVACVFAILLASAQTFFIERPAMKAIRAFAGARQRGTGMGPAK